MASGDYLVTFKKALDGTRAINLASDSFKVMLLTSSYSPSYTVDSIYSDISANEVSGTGYTAGGTALSGLSWSTTGGVNKWTATSPSWTTATITARYCVFYDTSASNALITCFDFGVDKTSTTGTFTITIDSNGIFQMTTP